MADNPEFDIQDGLELALAYLDAGALEKGSGVLSSPDGDYTVVLYCHKCGRAAALDLSRDELFEENDTT